MGMIRVSDQVEEQLKKVADGRSMSATIEKMLAYCSSPEGFCPAPQDTQTNYEPYLLEHIDKRLDELKSLITDTAVDRVAAEGSADTRRAPGGKEWVPWDQMSYIIFTHDDDDPAWIIPASSVFQFKNGDPTAYAYFVKDNTIFMESMGRPEPLIKVTPEIREAIDKHFTYDD